ncbi:mechanosensitive ion channel family protein [Lederbergia sp. NSJ-179]|uniref:mechanosensitive ion channel family protein n=1 Tax=Lederbergia sp. NSJ-179 TaxID=2931402 RepID=UPI001FD097BB|nr:mechanosensitive ion channel family protein [Lederbergia sp. NSJ-179]MCJ7840124.1 mechanosensitive ion channel family protein [Lederbergia sp. NSJ-179]
MFWNTWQHYFSFENLKSLAIAIIAFLFFLFLRKVFTKYVFAFFFKLTQKVPGELFSNIVRAFEKPMQWLFIIIGLYIAVAYFPYLDKTNPLFLHLVRAAIIYLVGWGLFNLADSSSTLFKKISKKFNFNIDEILIPLLSKSLRFMIVAITIAVIAEEFEYNVSTFVAGLGIGGLAFALAAKDALANLFGGVVIITEKPFTIGDWILTPTVEGTVEDITFRSTKIRTFADAVVTVPNSTLANEAITNWSKMKKRQISFKLRLPHHTSREKVEKTTRKMEELLRNHPGVHPETIFVKFDEFKENGYELMLYFFTKTTNWGEYLDIKEEINLNIISILDDEDLSIAIPVRKLLNESNQEGPEKEKSVASES